MKQTCASPLFLILVLFAGCGGDLKTYRIPGKLVYEDGSPVPGASVVLQTKVGDQIVAARGVASPDGRFDLATFKEADGVVAGEHEVSISPLPVAEGVKVARPVIPALYWDFATSGLKTTVAPDTPEIILTINRSK